MVATLDDLLKHFRGKFFRPYTSWDWHYEWINDFELSGTTLTVRTANREILGHQIGYSETYRFDISTGQMVNSPVKYGGLMARFVIFAIVLLVSGYLASWVTKRIECRMQ